MKALAGTSRQFAPARQFSGRVRREADKEPNYQIEEQAVT